MPAFSGVSSRQETRFEAFTESANIFSGMTVEKATKHAREAFFRPTNMNSDGPFDFFIPQEGDLYLNPATLRLNGGFKVVKMVNGVETALAAADTVATVNLAPISFFKSMEIDFQGQIVSFISTPLHHYKSFIESLLSYDANVQATHLKAALWEPDDAGVNYGVCKGDNSGWQKRANKIKTSQINYFSIDLHSDLASTDKFWPNKLDITIRLNRAPDTFSLMAEKPTTGGHPEYKIVFTELVLAINKVQLSPQTLAKHEASFRSGSMAVYPFNKSVIKTKQVQKGLDYAKLDFLFMNELPNSCIVGMVKSSAFNGSIERNPFHFEHFNLNYLHWDRNNEIIPANGIRPNFKTGDYIKEYRRLFDHTGIGVGNLTNNITPELFLNGMTLFPADFSPDMCMGYHNHEKDSGSMSLELHFSEALAEGITVICFACYDDFVELDAGRNVVFTSSAKP